MALRFYSTARATPATAAHRLLPLGRSGRFLATATRVRDWNLLPSGHSRWRTLKDGDAHEHPYVAQEGHVVRVRYVAKLDDGVEAARGRLSFRVGSRSDGVCAAIDEGVAGMRLGDQRRIRASPQSVRGTSLAHAPAGEMLEYDVTLTGLVAHRQIYVLDEASSSFSNPFELLADLGKRSLMSLLRVGARLTGTSK